MKIKSTFLLLILCCFTTLFSQSKLDTVIAQQGDGIFSILRRSGIDPAKYYADFLELNKEEIKGASELAVGVKYILPNASDSFKNMGTFINVDENEEVPLFDAELLKMKKRDSSLNNTVYYLIYPSSRIQDKKGKLVNNFNIKLSKDLMERGARVYVLQKKNILFTTNMKEVDDENSVTDFGNLTSIINKKYLSHNGSYQRVLLVRDSKLNEKGMSITMHHYDKSVDGQRLAGSFREIFKNNALGKVKTNQGISVFVDKPSVYLAKNLLPSLTIMDINGELGGISIRSGKYALPQLITKGILQDHANLNFTD